MTVALVALLKPFLALALLVAIRPLVEWFRRSLPDGKIKRVLFISWN